MTADKIYVNYKPDRDIILKEMNQLLPYSINPHKLN